MVEAVIFAALSAASICGLLCGFKLIISSMYINHVQDDYAELRKIREYWKNGNE